MFTNMFYSCMNSHGCIDLKEKVCANLNVIHTVVNHNAVFIRNMLGLDARSTCYAKLD